MHGVIYQHIHIVCITGLEINMNGCVDKKRLELEFEAAQRNFSSYSSAHVCHSGDQKARFMTCLPLEFSQRPYHLSVYFLL